MVCGRYSQRGCSIVAALETIRFDTERHGYAVGLESFEQLQLLAATVEHDHHHFSRDVLRTEPARTLDSILVNGVR